jgi:hypothetical protein
MSSTTSKIAMLLRLDFLHGTSRYQLFQDKTYPLKVVYIFCRRLQFEPTGNSPMFASAWFVWDKRYKGKPYIDWIYDLR